MSDDHSERALGTGSGNAEKDPDDWATATRP